MGANRGRCFSRETTLWIESVKVKREFDIKFKFNRESIVIRVEICTTE